MTISPYASKPWLRSYATSVPEFIQLHSYLSLADLLSKTSEKYKNNLAYTVFLPNGFQSSLTFEQVEEYSNNFANYLLYELNLKKGDRIAVQMPNCLSYPIAVFGILKAALVLVNLNPLYTENEIEHALKDSEAKAIVIVDIFAHKLQAVLPRTAIKDVITCSVADFFPSVLKQIIYLKQKYIDKSICKLLFPVKKMSEAVHFLNQKQTPWLTDAGWISLDDMACLQYTGGTTGKSKGAVLTHKNILSNIFQVSEFAKPRIDLGKETVLTALPMYHIFSFTVNCLFFYCMGARNVLIPNPKPIKNLQLPFKKIPFTWMTGVNTLYQALILENWFIKNPPKKLKISVAGGMPLLTVTAQKWSKIVPGQILEGYGMTETSPVITFNPIGGIAKDGSIGVPVPSTEIKLVDANEAEVPLGEPGELCIKGPQVMKGYWNNSEETTLLIKDGWIFTGDIAVMDEQGYFKIVDRKKDMILVSGFNVYPNEIEDIIQKIDDILECAVIGVPDGVSGEAVKAFVVSKDLHMTEKHIIDHCRKFLTGYKVPKYVEFKMDLPKSPVGKILKRELKK